MNDPSTYWLTLTNAALGLITLLCCLAVGIGVVQELAARRKKSTAMSHLDSEGPRLVASFGDRHAFHTPSLGVTMADGVRYGRNSTVRKLIPLATSVQSDEKCASPSHASCPLYQSVPGEKTAFGPCPYLRESLMQHCGAASVARIVPYSESLLSRCGNDSYRYRPLCLAMAHPGQPADDIDGIALPNWLRYSANHMWLDVTDDGAAFIPPRSFSAISGSSAPALHPVAQALISRNIGSQP